MASAGTVEQRKVAAQALVDAGFRGEVAGDMMRIASRESGFVPTAHAQDSDDDSYGLWQINTIGNLWGEVLGYGIVSAKRELFDPGKNAKVAKAMYDRYGFSPWQINGSHLTDTLPPDQLITGSLGVGDVIGSVPVVGDVVDVVADVTKAQLSALQYAGKALSVMTDPRFWQRVGLGLLGVAVCVIAFYVWRAGSAIRLASGGPGAAAGVPEAVEANE